MKKRGVITNMYKTQNGRKPERLMRGKLAIIASSFLLEKCRDKGT